MQHVCCIETRVARVGHDNLVGREILAYIRVGLAYRIHCEQEGALADLIAVSPVFQMPYGADSEYEALGLYAPVRNRRRGISGDHRFKQCNYLLQGQPLPRELGGVALEAVRNNLSRIGAPEYP